MSKLDGLIKTPGATPSERFELSQVSAGNTGRRAANLEQMQQLLDGDQIQGGGGRASFDEDVVEWDSNAKRAMQLIGANDRSFANGSSSVLQKRQEAAVTLMATGVEAEAENRDRWSGPLALAAEQLALDARGNKKKVAGSAEEMKQARAALREMLASGDVSDPKTRQSVKQGIKALSKAIDRAPPDKAKSDQVGSSGDDLRNVEASIIEMMQNAAEAGDR